MSSYASTRVPGCMTFWKLDDNGRYIAVEVCEPGEAGPKAVPFKYAVRFGNLARTIDFYFDTVYQISANDFQIQLDYAMDTLLKQAK